MAKRIILFSLIIAIGVSLMFLLKPKFNVDFATGVSVRYKYAEKDINQKINDVNTINQLKSILKGVTYTDTPSCGFSMDISITFSSNEKTVILCPALDGCSIIRINDSNRYLKISDEGRENLNQLLAPYGFKFPSL